MFLLVRLFHEDVAVLPAATLHRHSPVLASKGDRGRQSAAHRQHSLTGIHSLRFYYLCKLKQNKVQVYQFHCDLGCVCFVLLIVSPHCEQEKNKHNLGDNGMDMPV